MTRIVKGGIGKVAAGFTVTAIFSLVLLLAGPLWLSPVEGEAIVVSSAAESPLKAGETPSVVSAGMPPGRIESITFRPEDPLGAQNVKITVRGADGKTASVSTGGRVLYAETGPRAEIKMTPFYAKSDQTYSIAFEKKGVPAVALERDGGGISLTAGVRAKADPGTKTGIAAALVFAWGMWLVSAVPLGKKAKKAAALTLMFITIAAALSGFFAKTNALGISDWDYYFTLHTTYRDTLLKHGQFPLWNPWTAGGTSALGDPEF